jgi:hypothetical protein
MEQYRFKGQRFRLHIVMKGAAKSYWKGLDMGQLKAFSDVFIPPFFKVLLLLIKICNKRGKFT